MSYANYTPPGPWTDGQLTTRNFDGVQFYYTASINALTVTSNQSGAKKDANHFSIINVPDPVNPLDAANKEYVDRRGGIVWSSLNGLYFSTAGSSATFSVTPGVCADSTNHDMMILASSISKTTGAWVVGSGNGSLDTGTIAASTWYHAHLIKRTDTGVVDILTSLSPIFPTLPPGYTEFRRIFALRTDASSNWVLVIQLGDEFVFGTRFSDASAVAWATSASLVTLTVPTGIQVDATFNVRCDYATNSGIFLITSPDELDQVPSSVISSLAVSAANTTEMGMFITRTNTNSQIRVRASVTGPTYSIGTFGWIDHRGRDAYSSFTAVFGTASGVGAASAVSLSAAVGTGSSTGTSTANAVTIAPSAAVGAASGVGAASAIGPSIAVGTGSSAGTSTASATPVPVSIGAGAASGVGAASAIRSAAVGTGSSAGVGAASAVGAETVAAVGATSGVGAASAVTPVTMWTPSSPLNQENSDSNYSGRVVVPLTAASLGYIQVQWTPNATSTDPATDFTHMGIGKWSGANATCTATPIEVTWNGGGHGLSLAAASSPVWSDWINVSSLTLNSGDSVVVTWDNGPLGGYRKATGLTNGVYWFSTTVPKWNVVTGDSTNGFTQAFTPEVQGVSSIQTRSSGAAASLSGTTIPPATQIVDSVSNIWTVSGGVIYKNGVAAGISSNVILLLYYNGVIYQENNANLWWSWNGTTWISVAGDPRATTSPSGTTIPSATQIVDSSGNVWTVSGGVVYENGVTAGFSANVILLLYYNGVIYQENNANLWWSWSGTAWVSAAGDPRVTTPSITGISPASGTTAGGTSVVITGTNFTGTTLVKFGATNAASYTVNLATQITAVSPAGSTGTTDITVTTPNGTSATSGSDQFTFFVPGVVPTVTALSVTSGPTTGGLNVTLTGTNFTGATAVHFGATNAPDYLIASPTSIIVTSPSGSGATNVTVTNSGGTSSTGSGNAFTFSGGAGTAVTKTANYDAYNWSNDDTGRNVPYHALLVPWGTLSGATWSIACYPNTFPNGSVALSSGAYTGNNFYGSVEVNWGYFGFGGSEPPGGRTIPPQQWTAITQILTHHNISIQTDGGTSDVVYDFYLQNSPTYFGSAYPGLQFEVEISLHLPPAYKSSVQGLASAHSVTYTDQFSTQWQLIWNPTPSPPKMIFCRADYADQLIATFDVKELLTAAKNSGIMPGLTGNEWFMGWSIQNELQGNTFNWTLNSFIQNYGTVSGVAIGSASGTSTAPGISVSGSVATISADNATYNYSTTNVTPVVPYWAQLNPWNKGSLVNGTNYTESMTFYSNFPTGTSITWSWPSTPASNNIYANLFVGYGAINTQVPVTTITASQISNITALQSTHNLSIGGNTANFEVFYYINLMSAASGGTYDFSINIYLHVPSYRATYLAALATQYTFTDSQGTSWTIYLDTTATPHQIDFAPTSGADLLHYNVDILGLLNAAIGHGLFASTEYFTGFILGVNVQCNAGSLTYTTLTVNYTAAAGLTPPSGPTVLLNVTDNSYRNPATAYNYQSPNVLTALPSPYWANQNPWNAGGLVRGVNFTASQTVYTNYFPRGTRFDWSWPSTLAGGSVYSADTVSIGDGYNVGANSNTPLPFTQLSDPHFIQLLSTHDVTINSGSLNDYHIMHEWFTTGVAGPQANSKSGTTGGFEISCFFAIGIDYNYVTGGTNKFTYTDYWGRTWAFSVVDAQMLDFAITPGPTNMLVGTMDFLYKMRLAVSHGAMDHFAASSEVVPNGAINQWFNGSAWGPEIGRNAGSFTLNKLVTEYNGVTYGSQDLINWNSGQNIFKPSVLLNTAGSNANTAMRVVCKLSGASTGYIRVLFCPNQTIGGVNTDFGHMGIGKWSGANATCTAAPIEIKFNNGQHGMSPTLISGMSARWSDWINISSLSLASGDSVVITFDNGAAGGCIHSTGNNNATLWTSATLGNWNVATGDSTNGFSQTTGVCKGIWAIQTSSTALSNLP